MVNILFISPHCTPMIDIFRKKTLPTLDTKNKCLDHLVSTP